MNEHEKNLAYYISMLVLCAVFAIKFISATEGKDTLTLATDWQSDHMYVVFCSDDGVINPTFIAPDGDEIIPTTSHVSLPYITYTLDTSGYEKGKWKMKYPRNKTFTYHIEE